MTSKVLRGLWSWFTNPSLFFVMCGLFCLEMYYSGQRSKLDVTTISPQNLKRVAESFRLNLLVEKRRERFEDFADSEAWEVMNQRLSGYGDRLELYRKQDFHRRYVIMGLYMWATFVLVGSQNRRKDSQGEMGL